MKNILVAFAALFAMSSANAASVYFSGTTTETCTIYTVQSGVLASDNNEVIQSSNVAGGMPAKIMINTNGNGFVGQVSGPSSFISSPTLNFTPTFDVNATFTSGASIGQMWNHPAQNVADAAIPAGANEVEIFLASFAGTGNTFPLGFYDAFATVSCTAL